MTFKLNFFFLLALLSVYALYNMAFSTGMFLGPVAAGFLMDIGGFTAVMVAFAISLVVCTPIIVDWVDVWHKIKNRNA